MFDSTRDLCNRHFVLKLWSVCFVQQWAKIPAKYFYVIYSVMFFVSERFQMWCRNVHLPVDFCWVKYDGGMRIEPPTRAWTTRVNRVYHTVDPVVSTTEGLIINPYLTLGCHESKDWSICFRLFFFFFFKVEKGNGVLLWLTWRVKHAWRSHGIVKDVRDDLLEAYGLSCLFDEVLDVDEESDDSTR